MVLALQACSYYRDVMPTKINATNDRVVTAVRMPSALHDRLRGAAEDRDLSVNYLVNKAVEEFLERLIPAEELRLTRDRVN
jgi:predicted DNA-binding protein